MFYELLPFSDCHRVPGLGSACEELRLWLGGGLASLQPWGTQERGLDAQGVGKEQAGESQWDLEPG